MTTDQADEGDEPVVIILKKTQGSVWSEHGRTRLCPTHEWLRKRHGSGQFELRLLQRGRILCIASAEAMDSNEDGAETATRSRFASDSGRAPSRTLLRGTALG